jgi:hypothetical protein
VAGHRLDGASRAAHVNGYGETFDVDARYDQRPYGRERGKRRAD